MKNCYLSQRRIADAMAFSPIFNVVQTVDKEATELFEKLNPVLSNGHRDNIITRLMDKNVPREVADVIMQLVTTVPHDKSNKGYTDEQIQATIVSRHYQSEIELDQVRHALDDIASDLFPDEPSPAEPAPSESAPASPAAGSTSPT
mgnify:CR=1 FL=1